MKDVAKVLTEIENRISNIKSTEHPDIATLLANTVKVDVMEEAYIIMCGSTGITTIETMITELKAKNVAHLSAVLAVTAKISGLEEVLQMTK